MSCANNQQQLYPVILDMDNAMGMPVRDPDDGLALALALSSPELEILGCTASPGNCQTNEAVQCTTTLLAAAGRSDIPVFHGAQKPLFADRTAHHELLDAKSAGAGKHYWNAACTGAGRYALSTAAQQHPPEPHCSQVSSPFTPAPDESAASVSAHRFIIDTIRARPHEVTLIMLGGFTNLALALRESPEIASQIKEVIHMGGIFTPADATERELVWTTPDLPEAAWETLRFNTWYDPEATVEVVASGVPLRFISANVTVHVFLREAHLAHMANSPHLSTCEQWRSFLIQNSAPWVEWSRTERCLEGAHMHDPLTVACVFAPSLCTYTTMYFDTEAFLHNTDCLCREPAPHRHPVQVATNVAAEQFEALLLERLCSPPLSNR